jgi:hypothetical protein
MQTRPSIIAIIAFPLGLLVGSTLAPVNIWPHLSVERENTRLREENRLLTEMVTALKTERGEVRKVLGRMKQAE